MIDYDKYINITSNVYQFLISRPLESAYYKLNNPEKDHQTKIKNYLEKRGFKVINIVVAGTAGNSDLFACSLAGQLWKIEVKRECKKLRKLQEYKLRMYSENKAVTICAYGFKDFEYKFKVLYRDHAS